jgi:fatty acid amide hydrolase
MTFGGRMKPTPLSEGSMDQITSLGATEIAHKIARGDLSSSEVVEAHILRIESVNERLNAVIAPLFDRARADAARADEALKRGESAGPLHGVPITLKDSFDVAGTATNMGLSDRLSHRADRDGPLAARLRQAGAIILGKTNVAQMLMFNETDNPVYGRTNNPWNPDRSPGGSSGGEASIIAAKGSPLGLGSDIGGSIRLPAHVCGIHAFKPTSGRLTTQGHAALYAGMDAVRLQPGPLARSVPDLNLALGILAAPGQELFDPSLAPAPWRDSSDVDLGSLRIAFYTDNGFIEAAPALRRAVMEAAAALRDRGAKLR